MRVYKFRNGREFLERDLSSICNNHFWAPSIGKLNDPFEAMVGTDRFEKEFNIFSSAFRVKNEDGQKEVKDALNNLIDRREKVGIFSLSKTIKNELLWSHYGDSHFGFCIEYDLSSLLISRGYLKRYLVNVKYSKKPSSIRLKDVSKSPTESLFQKIFGFKSKVWAYEDEVRIVTDRTKAQYHDYTAVKGIYFGVRMKPDVQTKIMYSLRGRGIKYYKIFNSDGKYNLSTRSVLDEYIDAIPYSERNESNDMKLPRHEIRNHDRGRYPDVGKADVTIFTRLTKLELDELTIQIKHKYHSGVKRLFVSYHLPDMNFDSVVWASSRMEGESVDSSITGLTKEKFDLLSEFAQNDERKILGSWMDLLWLMTLYEQDGRLYFEMRSSLESEHTVEVISNTVENGIRLEDINENSHGEYKVLRTDGTLEYYGKDGLFETHTAISRE